MPKEIGVIQLDYKTGEVIEEYLTIRDAAQDNYITEQYLRIVLKSNGGIMYQKKLRFVRCDEFEKITNYVEPKLTFKRKSFNGKKIAKLDFYTGEILEVYPSITIAAEKNSLDKTNLSRTLKKGGKMRNKQLRFSEVKD
ncbi:MAG: hypothetical protein ATN36_06670 [Epulopiscium sp. Nele67-Bin005]|nr:MAG: hypothetical protein ATN36_06670 [Epulopiscium sp. Nele67-Bin005]